MVFIRLEQKSKLESHKKICENKDFCGVAMPSEDTKILQFNLYHKSDKRPSNIYADIESLIKRMDGCKNDFENSSKTKVGEHIPCQYSLSRIWTFDSIENKHDVYRREDCMKKLCESLKQHKMTLTNEQKESYEKTKFATFAKSNCT